MKKAIFRNADDLLVEYTIAPHPGRKNKFVIQKHTQYQVGNFPIMAFKSKQFNSRTSAANYLLLHLNRQLESGEISQLIIT